MKQKIIMLQSFSKKFNNLTYTSDIQQLSLSFVSSKIYKSHINSL